MDKLFNDLFNKDTTNNKLKDRMKTLIMKAKQGTKQQFIEALARDYINISREL